MYNINIVHHIGQNYLKGSLTQLKVKTENI